MTDAVRHLDSLTGKYDDALSPLAGINPLA